KKGDDPPPIETLFNPLLSPKYSHWLVGPIAFVASIEEIDAYLALDDDANAEAFIEDFWARRAADLPVFSVTPRETYQARLTTADKRFREGVRPGSATARGILFILHGEPESIERPRPRRVDDLQQEQWFYPKDASPGLNGQAPQRLYRFVEIEGRMVRFTGQRARRGPRRP
ncbi:MAG: GWxTD domain-containing protein, partial [Acidobacteriota bacterium]